jgi:hypothetical protein
VDKRVHRFDIPWTPTLCKPNIKPREEVLAVFEATLIDSGEQTPIRHLPLWVGGGTGCSESGVPGWEKAWRGLGSLLGVAGDKDVRREVKSIGAELCRNNRTNIRHVDWTAWSFPAENVLGTLGV